jgi:hypothetical protein
MCAVLLALMVDLSSFRKNLVAGCANVRNLNALLG